MATRRELLLEAARKAQLKQTRKTVRKGGPVATRQQEGLTDVGGKRQVPTKPDTSRAKQIAAYKAAHKSQNMGGMIAAAGGDMAKLSGLHNAAYPSGSSLPKKNGATTTKTTTKAKATTESRGRLQMEKAAPPKKKAVTAPAVESRGRLQGGAAKSRSAPKAGTSTAVASRSRLQSSGRGTAALAGPKPRYISRVGPGAGKAGGANIKQLGKTIKAGGKAVVRAKIRSDAAIISGLKKAGQAARKKGRGIRQRGLTF